MIKSVTDLSKIEKEQREIMKQNDEEDKRRRSYSEAVKETNQRKKSGEKLKEREETEAEIIEEFNCNKCQFQSESRKVLLEHIQNSHNAEVNCQCEKYKYKCDVTTELKMHMKECHTEKCKQCQYKLEEEKQMRRHIAQCHETQEEETEEEESGED